MTKPALTPEEWAENGHPLVEGYIDWDLGFVDVTDPYSSDRTRFRHALAALALRDQPFGFTREDVAMLRDAEQDLAGRPGWDSDLQRISSLADRIEALLPPEDA